MVHRPTRAAVVLCSLLAAACSDDSTPGSVVATGGGGGSGGAGTGGAGGVVPGDPNDWLDRPLREQVDALDSGVITSNDLTLAYLARVQERDTGADGIHAVLALDPDATDDAAMVDGARGEGALLQGAPLLLKDNIETQGLATTAGSLAMVDNVPDEDAFVVARLRAAHAVVLGKANLSEWANFRGSKSTSGWSSVGGQTKNGVDPAYNPCGSSSGSAAGVAAGLASAALGSETNGSITCPAAFNGLVGLKPTVGLVSRAGGIPASHTQDTFGPIARTVGDAARLLTVIAGSDPADPATLAIPADLDLDFEAPLASATLAGKRLGVVDFGSVGGPTEAIFAAERARLEAAGAIVVDVALDTTSFWNDEYVLLTHELKANMDGYLGGLARPGVPKSLQEVIAFNDAHADTVLVYFGQEFFLAAQATTGLDAPAYLAAKQSAHDKTTVDGIDAALAADDLDALIAPTGRPAFETNYATGDTGFGGFAAGPAAVAGYPHLTVPMGVVDTRPVGLSFFGAAWHDGQLLALGYAYEQLRQM